MFIISLKTSLCLIRNMYVLMMKILLIGEGREGFTSKRIIYFFQRFDAASLIFANR